MIPVVVIERLEDALPLATALYQGGLKLLEITLRTPVALDAIRLIKESLPDAIIASGTVINAQSLEASLEAGADFIVSPGVSDELLAAAKSNDAPLLPGAVTATEVMKLLDKGYDRLKFFPAEAAGGVASLAALNGPLPQAKFCPTGGINLNNASQYLSLDNVVCVGGTWMLKRDLIQRKNWQEITRLAQQASQIR